MGADAKVSAAGVAGMGEADLGVVAAGAAWASTLWVRLSGGSGGRLTHGAGSGGEHAREGSGGLAARGVWDTVLACRGSDMRDGSGGALAYRGAVV